MNRELYVIEERRYTVTADEPWIPRHWMVYSTEQQAQTGLQSRGGYGPHYHQLTGERYELRIVRYIPSGESL